MLRQPQFHYFWSSSGLPLAAMVSLALLTAVDDRAAAADPAESIAAIRKLGGLVLPVAQNDPRVDISLHLTDTKIGDDHLLLVAAVPEVASLNLRGTVITDAGLAHLAGLKSLRKLHLERTAVTDAGLQHLAGLENLEYLNLYGTKTTDAGLESLAGLKQLKKLFLWQTEVTDAGVAKLKEAIPGLIVVRGGAPVAPPAEPRPEEPKPAG